jgi:hypothetical protein
MTGSWSFDGEGVRAAGPSPVAAIFFRFIGSWIVCGPSLRGPLRSVALRYVSTSVNDAPNQTKPSGCPCGIAKV